jgi:hypothetical protein
MQIKQRHHFKSSKRTVVENRFFFISIKYLLKIIRFIARIATSHSKYAMTV